MAPGALKVLASPIILNLLCLFNDWVEVYLVSDQQASNKCFIFVLLACSSIHFYISIFGFICCPGSFPRNRRRRRKKKSFLFLMQPAAVV
mmetsp:Transcript_29525/g.66830  ORF Transcript_29525/g.66830 Transcript_29525/m.66830 type:complete len:90 (+) Transcript_29525:1516-1785(+)